MAGTIVDSKIQFSPLLIRIISLFKSYEEINEMYLCGGCMRDYFMHKPTSKDIDIFVNCSSAELNKFVNYLRDYGIIDYGQYGSPRFYLKDELFYIDLVPFYNFIVSEKPIDSIDSLLKNFDFTANAIGYNIKNGEIYNPVGGIQDINAKILRAVRLDFPEKKVSSNIDLSAVTVFWFRLLHYQCKLGFIFDKMTKKWVLDNRWRYGKIAKFEKYFFSPLISQEMLELIKS